MEATEEATGPNLPADELHTIVAKRKRTKRQRIPPLSLSSSSGEFSSSNTEEEEDMANCLILLAQGSSADSFNPKQEVQEEEHVAVAVASAAASSGKFTSRRFSEAATTTGGKAGFYVYECKTCSKCFPSFQALGGHRASHKKPKLSVPPATIDEDSIQLSINSFSAPTTDPVSATNTADGSGKPRVHECSICGSMFSSGQALGGHMRRHRPANLSEQREAKKEKNPLSLDLNLPAPSDEDHHRSGGGEPRRSLSTVSAAPSTAFAFSRKPQLLFPSTSALVDCPY